MCESIINRCVFQEASTRKLLGDGMSTYLFDKYL